MFAELIENGRMVEWIIGLTVVEAVGLILLRKYLGRGPNPADILILLAAGFFFLIALRAALVGDGWFWVAFGLTGSLIAHLADLARRFLRG